MGKKKFKIQLITNAPEEPTLSDYRTDMNHYWTRLMWYRDELWRITNPIFIAYGAFILAMFGYLFAKDTNINTMKIINLLILVINVTYILIRLYFIYSTRIYAAIKYLNHELEIREQRLYKKFQFFPDFDNSREHFESNYRTFQVVPGSHILFGIIIVMMSGILNLLLISMLLDSKIWSFDTNNLFFALLMTCVVCGFELYIKTFTRTCDLESKSN